MWHTPNLRAEFLSQNINEELTPTHIAEVISSHIEQVLIPGYCQMTLTSLLLTYSTVQ